MNLLSSKQLAQVIDKLPEDFINNLMVWLNKQPFSDEIFNNQIIKTRQSAWYGLGMRNYNDPEPETWYAQPINRNPLLIELIQKYAPNTNSILIYKYQKGASIKEHYDKGFEPTVTLINLVVATPDLLNNYPECQFKWRGMGYSLKHGSVFQFNSHELHELKPVPCIRYSIQLRTMLEQFYPF
jgi:hypothetical protein